METPVFEEFDPASDCDCPGCTHWRRVNPYSPAWGASRFGGHPAARRALVVATAAAATLGAGHAVPALAAPQAPGRPGVPAGDEPQTPQGGKAPLHGPGGRPAQPTAGVGVPATTRAEIIRRAGEWAAARVPYSMSSYWSDGYRQDCSGFVSMAWQLPGNEWTGTLGQYGTRISKEELQPGDILLFHNPADPQNGSHVVIFGGWTDYTHTYYIAYEQTRPTARRQATPYAYWSHADRYVPYRYKGLVAGSGAGSGAGASGGAAPVAPYPGPSSFGPGANNPYVTQLGRHLVARGGARFYTSGPGPRWSGADRRATQAFQQAQGWRGANADGLPGPQTWRLLVTGRGRGIAPTAPSPATGAAGPPAPSAPRVPAFPGRGVFRPGAHNTYVTQLGRQLVKKGFGKYYAQGPGPRWGEADRRAVEAFQRTQGWRGGAADGHPGPETWRRLFS
ncbi:peptidoglycan-binding protein [Streptomyces sp. T028]|uniref:peptidoglycan-binding protein n=1 Tax=Streptomyces sp. T028 TaxID=3394379 RepID=UPI003A882E58